MHNVLVRNKEVRGAESLLDTDVHQRPLSSKVFTFIAFNIPNAFGPEASGTVLNTLGDLAGWDPGDGPQADPTKGPWELRLKVELDGRSRRGIRTQPCHLRGQAVAGAAGPRFQDDQTFVVQAALCVEEQRLKLFCLRTQPRCI